MFGHGGSGAYTLMAFVLGLVAIYMLWHGRHTLPLGVVAPLATSLVVFALAPVPFWEWQLTTLEARFLRLWENGGASREARASQRSRNARLGSRRRC